MKPGRGMASFATALVAGGCLMAALGCTVNPATGERQLSLIGEQQEIAMGRQADRDVVASFGLYDDQEWQDYIQRLGSELAAQSERPDLPWSFRVVDDPLVNAFALPGGYIYITRGILAHFNSEAQLVSVLGHEIGHVTARHSVQQMSQAQLANLGLGVAMIASEDFRDYAGLASQGLQLLFLKFGRDDEKQADDLGLRYMTRTGHDPNEMPEVFLTLDRVSEAAAAGDVPEWQSTHPNPERRAGRIADQVEELPEERRQGTVNRESYLRRLQGMPYGSNPREGYAIDNRFYHPDLEFQLVFPADWKIINTRQFVAALSPAKDAVVSLTLAREDSAEAALESFFAQAGIERGSVWNRQFHNFRTTASQQNSQVLRGLAGFLEHDGRIYRVMGYSSTDGWASQQAAVRRSVASFRRLTARRYLDVEPRRIEVVELPTAMTLAEFEGRYPSTTELETLAILNGVAVDQPLEGGRLVKRIVGGQLPDS